MIPSARPFFVKQAEDVAAFCLLKRGLFLAGALAVVGCAPLISQNPPESAVEGDAKSARTQVLTRLCYWDAPSRVRYRLTTSSTWTDLPAPTKTSGDIAFLRRSWWETPIAGSDNFRQGERYVVEWRIPYWGRSLLGCPSKSEEAVKTDQETFTVTRAFTVDASTVELPAGGTAMLTAEVNRFGGFSAPVTVSISGLASGVSVAPASQNVSGNSATFTLSADASTSAGSDSATVSGASPPRTAHQSTFTVTVTRPTVTGVNPAKAVRGATVSVQGTGFAPNCADNEVRLAGIDVVPSSCAGNSINARIPDAAAYGPTQLSVSVNGVRTNDVPFSVARAPGMFLEITGDINGRTNSPRTCSSNDVRLEITGTYNARYRQTSTNSQIGNTIPFEASMPPRAPYSGATPQGWLNAGGAGFSLCTTGIVLDPDTGGSEILAYRFLRLNDGSLFSKSFNYFTRVVENASGWREYSSVTPDLYRSQDGTVFIAVVASQVAVQKKALVIDRETGATLGTVELSGISGSFSANLTNSNTVVITHASTTYPGVAIP